MAFPTVLSVTETPVGVATITPTFNLPATVDAGDLLLLFVATADFAISAGPGGNWIELWNNGASNQGAGACYALDAVGDEDGGTVQVTCTSANTAAGQVYRITGWGGTVATDIDIVGDGTSTTGSNPDPSSVTADWGSDDNLFIAMCACRDDDATVNGYPTNYNDNQTDTVSGGGLNDGATCGTATRNYASASDDPGVFTLSESERWRTCTVVVEPGAVATYKLEGITKDKDGNTLATCDCHLFKLNVAEDDATWIAYDQSDGAGAYSFTGIGDNDAKYFVVAWKDDTPHVFDAGDHVLVPVEE